MTRSVIARIACATAVAFALAASTVDLSAGQKRGRYKKEDGKCVWVAGDTGPDQCEPPAGRFKKDGDKCVWDANDSGDDQCTPKKGRFKQDGDRCVWAADDSGPNQCTPKRPRG